MFPGSYLIVAVTFLFLGGVTVTYVLSVATGHVEPFWCFISYTGNFPVESHIFSMVLNLCSALYFLIVTLRYQQIVHVIEDSMNLSITEVPKKKNRINKLSLGFGFLGALGLSTTGSFQQRNFYLMHMFGVFCCTTGTSVYLVFQTYLSYTVMSSQTKKCLKIFRLVVTILSSGLLLVGAVFVLYYFARQPKWSVTRRENTKKDRSILFKIGTILEWLLFFMIQLYISSLYYDFKRITIMKDRISFQSERSRVDVH